MIAVEELAQVAPGRRAACAIDELTAQRRQWARGNRRPRALTGREVAALLAHECMVIWTLGANMRMGLAPTDDDFADLTTAMRLVHTLTDEAPAKLLAECNGIPGLTVGEDGALSLDGYDLDRLSGMKRLRFAVEIARRLNARSKLLCVDGLEVLDGEQRAAFLEMATADGYQLIATRVTEAGGDVVLRPLGGR